MGSERNAPCRCGSGRKAKTCCLAAGPPVPVNWRVIRERVMDMLMADVAQRLPEEDWGAVFDCYAPGLRRAPDDVLEVSAIPWLLSRWRPAAHEIPPPPGLGPNETFLERALRKRRDFGMHERRFLEAWAREPASLWTAEAGSDGQGTMRDAFRDRVHRARRDSKAIEEGTMMHARVLDMGGESIVIEAAPVKLTPGVQAGGEPRSLPAGDERPGGRGRRMASGA